MKFLAVAPDSGGVIFKKIGDKYETLENIKRTYKSETGWGINEVSVDVINSYPQWITEGW